MVNFRAMLRRNDVKRHIIVTIFTKKEIRTFLSQVIKKKEQVMQKFPNFLYVKAFLEKLRTWKKYHSYLILKNTICLFMASLVFYSKFSSSIVIYKSCEIPTIIMCHETNYSYYNLQWTWLYVYAQSFMEIFPLAIFTYNYVTTCDENVPCRSREFLWRHKLHVHL